MAEVRKRIKRQISDATEDSLQTSDSEGESSEGYDSTSGAPASATANMARPSRRSAGATNGTTSATISRSTSGSPDDRRQSIRLTVKAPPSKLREVMRANEVESLKDVIGGGQIVDGPRRSRNIPPPRASGRRPDKPRYAEYGESDIEDDEDEEEGDDDDDQDQDEEDDEDEPMQDAESEQDEDDEDQEMEDGPSPPKKSAPPPKTPKITLKQPASTNGKGLSNPKLVVTPAPADIKKLARGQEMEDDEEEDDDEDGSSELSEDEEEDEDEEEEEEEEEEEDEQEETMQLNAAATPSGNDMLGDDEELDEDEEDLDSDDESPGSGTATPDITKLTKRQRGMPDDSTELLALDMAPQQRKFFTDHEKAMKKDEHARKRKELTKRKIQEEKAAALNRLLKPQAHKARGGVPKPETLAAAAAAAGGSPYDDDEYQGKANPLYTRWVSTKDGVRLGVPEEWLGKRVGRVFGPPLPPSNGALIQEL